MMHLVSPASALLFTRGMSESGMIDSLPTAFSVNYSSTFASTRLNCTDVTGPTTQLECLRGLKAETVLLAQLQQNTEDFDLGGSYWFGQTCFQPTIDGGGDWPQCNVTSDISIVLKPTLPGGTFGTETGRRAKQCDLWDAIYAGHLHHQ